jgi:hypothetical protein
MSLWALKSPLFAYLPDPALIKGLVASFYVAYNLLDILDICGY